MSQYQQISAAELKQLESAQLQLLDVRNDEEIAHGMIPGALHIPLHLLPLRWKALDSARGWVIYCHSGVRSMHACEYLAQQGFVRLYNLRGGMLAWNSAGLSVETAISNKGTHMEFDKELDARGLNCPLPILRCKKALAELQGGQVLKVVATDPGSVKDFQAFARQTGHEMLSATEAQVNDRTEFTYYMRKRVD